MPVMSSNGRKSNDRFFTSLRRKMKSARKARMQRSVEERRFATASIICRPFTTDVIRAFDGIIGNTIDRPGSD